MGSGSGPKLDGRDDLHYSEPPDRSLNDQAWAAVFLLMIFVLVASLPARALLARSRRKLEGG